jgi:hypothetical protein
MRIYHYHIRKTAGTSLNAAFWRIANLNLHIVGRRVRICSEGLTFVQRDIRLIEAGDYFYAHSHHPAHTVSLPSGTFTITVLRDPAQRLISHYKYLLWAVHEDNAYKEEPYLASLLREERQWLGGSFDDFLARIPTTHLHRQLYMFSKTYDVDEAADKILRCSFVGFTETFDRDIAALRQTLQLPLIEQHERRFGNLVVLSSEQLDRVHHLVSPEKSLIAKVKAGLPRER